MKIKHYIAAILFCVILAVCFTSCGGKSDPADTVSETETDTAAITDTDTEAPETEPVPVDTEAPETVPDDELRVPIENKNAIEIIEYQYKKAVEIIDWVENCSLPTDPDIELTDGNGNIYLPIIDSVARAELDGEVIKTFSDLEIYISSVFSRAIADDLLELAEENYTDYEGALCLKTVYIDTEPKVDIDTTDTNEETGETESPEETESEGADTLIPEEPAQPKIVSTEFFLSKFTDKMFRYTAKVTYETTEEEKPAGEEPADGEEADTTAEEENIKYFDFIFENTGSGWFWTTFPKIS